MFTFTTLSCYCYFTYEKYQSHSRYCTSYRKSPDRTDEILVTSIDILAMQQKFIHELRTLSQDTALSLLLHRRTLISVQVSRLRSNSTCQSRRFSGDVFPRVPSSLRAWFRHRHPHLSSCVTPTASSSMHTTKIHTTAQRVY